MSSPIRARGFIRAKRLYSPITKTTIPNKKEFEIVISVNKLKYHQHHNYSFAARLYLKAAKRLQHEDASWERRRLRRLADKLPKGTRVLRHNYA